MIYDGIFIAPKWCNENDISSDINDDSSCIASAGVNLGWQSCRRVPPDRLGRLHAVHGRRSSMIEKIAKTRCLMLLFTRPTARRWCRSLWSTRLVLSASWIVRTRCSSWRSRRGNWHLSRRTGMKDDRLRLQLQDSVKNAVFTPGQPQRSIP